MLRLAASFVVRPRIPFTLTAAAGAANARILSRCSERHRLGEPL